MFSPRYVQQLAADVNVAGARAQSVATRNHALDEQVGQLRHQLTVFEGARLRFVGVAHEVARHTLGLSQKAPLHARGEARATAAPQARLLHFFHYLVGRHGFERLFHGAVAAVLAVHLEGVNAFDVNMFS
jgi:hypothetical protein